MVYDGEAGGIILSRDVVWRKHVKKFRHVPPAAMSVLYCLEDFFYIAHIFVKRFQLTTLNCQVFLRVLGISDRTTEDKKILHPNY